MTDLEQEQLDRLLKKHNAFKGGSVSAEALMTLPHTHPYVKTLARVHQKRKENGISFHAPAIDSQNG